MRQAKCPACEEWMPAADWQTHDYLRCTDAMAFIDPAPSDDPDRCPEYLEVPVPDTPGYPGSSMVFQCVRPIHVKGVHRFKGEFTWSGKR